MGLAKTLAMALWTRFTNGVLKVANGGTGVSTPGDSGNVLTSNGTSWTSSALSAGNIDIQAFTSSGTWTKPANADKVLIRSWGAGGSGARRSAGNASGGGGGGYEEKWLDASALSATETVTIGAGGAAISGGDGDGNRGGDNQVGLGSNLATNGTFDSDTAWTKGTGWTIGSGVATCDGSQTPNESELLLTGVSLSVDTIYLVEFDYTRSAGGLIVRLGTERSLNFISSSGSAQLILTTKASADFAFVASGTFAGTVDNVTVKAVKMHHSGGSGGLQVAASTNVNGGYSGGYLGRSQNAVSAVNPLNPLTGVTASTSTPNSTSFALGSCGGSGATSGNGTATSSSISLMGGGGGAGIATTGTASPSGKGGMSFNAGNGGSGNSAGAGEDGGDPGGGGGAGTTTSGAGGDGKIEIITLCGV